MPVLLTEQRATENLQITADKSDTWAGQNCHLIISKQNERHVVAVKYLFHFAIHKVAYSRHVCTFALWVEHTTF